MALRVIPKLLPSGLWGSKASQIQHASLLPFNLNVSSKHILSGTDIVFCSVNLLLCPVNACVSPPLNFELWWRGTSCNGYSANVYYVCDWGWSNTTATFAYDEYGKIQKLVCQVPFLPDVTDSSLIPVLVHPVLSAGALVPDDAPYSNFFHTTTKGPFGELSSHPILVRYVSNQQICGCSPFLQLSNATCDMCNVCGGNRSTVDCNGDCFGSAYFDSGGVCSRGLTGVNPLIYGDDLLVDWDTYFHNLFKWIILVLAFGCFGCGSAIFLFCIRVILLATGTSPVDIAESDPSFSTRIRRINPTGAAGLTFDQINSIGEFVYDARSQLITECPICLATITDGEICRKLPLPCEHLFHKEVSNAHLKICVLRPLTVSNSALIRGFLIPRCAQFVGERSS